jgi:hypothetical protein
MVMPFCIVMQRALFLNKKGIVYVATKSKKKFKY